jgi:hypothetical protein
MFFEIGPEASSENFVNRCAELNRREVDEKAEHLRLLSWLTGVITSFTMTTPVEFNYDAAVSTVHDLPLVAVMLYVKGFISVGQGCCSRFFYLLRLSSTSSRCDIYSDN